MLNRRTVLKGAIATPFATSVLAASARAGVAQDDPIVVGSKDFTEQFILGNMYLLVLEDMGLDAEEALNLGGTQIAHQALISDEIDTYPEYTGTALVEVLGMSVEEVLAGFQGGAPAATPVTDAPPAATPVAAGGETLQDYVYNIVKDAYQEQFDLTWLAYSPFNNTQALAVKRSWSEEQGITTISQLAEVAGDLTISAPADFPEREDGLLGLQRVYDSGFNDIEALPVAPGLKYQALLDDDAEVVLAFGTDGQIAGYDLIVLEDDMGLWPPYNVAPVIHAGVISANPDIEQRFNDVTTSLTGEVMSGLNWRVDGDEKAEPADVAREYLEENGLIGG